MSDSQFNAIMLELTQIRALVTATAKDAPAPAASGDAASDYDLDSQYGDPVVKKDPPRWKGNSFVGYQFSQCPADYLDVLAGLLDWQARKDDEQGKTWTNKKGEEVPSSSFKRKDAARARGWAARIRAGKVTQVVTDRSASSDSSDIPF